MAHSSTPSKFWHFAFETAVYLINRLPTQINHGKSPFELIFGITLDYLCLKTFGCLCFPYLRPYNKHKITYRSQPCVFLDRSSGRIYIARHVQFDESVFPFKSILGQPPAYPSKSQPWFFAPCIVESSTGPLSPLYTTGTSSTIVLATPKCPSSSPTTATTLGNPSHTPSYSPNHITKQPSSRSPHPVPFVVDLNSYSLLSPPASLTLPSPHFQEHRNSLNELITCN